MKFTSSLIKGKLIKRYKRFFVDIKVNNSIITAHCPNTGSMMGLLDQGNKVWVTKNDNPKRKTSDRHQTREGNKLTKVRIIKHTTKLNLHNVPAQIGVIRKINTEIIFNLQSTTLNQLLLPSTY